MIDGDRASGCCEPGLLGDGLSDILDPKLRRER